MRIARCFIFFCLSLPVCAPADSYNPADPSTRAYTEWWFLRCLTGEVCPEFSCPFLNWKDARKYCWPTIQAHLQSQQALGSCGSVAVNNLGSFAATQKWTAGVLAVTGAIHGISQNKNQFLRIITGDSAAAASGT